MKRSKSYYRWHRNRTIKKKITILKFLGGEEYVKSFTNGKFGRLSKGKVHCSCRMCRKKSYIELSHRDAKQKESALQQILEC